MFPAIRDDHSSSGSDGFEDLHGSRPEIRRGLPKLLWYCCREPWLEMKRRILLILVTETVEQPQWILVAKETGLQKLIGMVLKPNVRGEQDARWNPADFQLFDWNSRLLPADIRVGEIPLPGIVIAVVPFATAGRILARSEGVDHWLFRQTLMRDQTSMDRLSRFLSSPDAAAVPRPLKEIDVFISYSFQDGALAAEVVRGLESRGLQVFLAESSLSSTRQWREQIRDAVRSSRTAILLITPCSARSAWVMAEAGALAVQEVPTVVLLDGMEPEHMPEPLRTVATIEPANRPDLWLETVGELLARGRKAAED
jgi:hypothetical protein